MSEGGHHKRNVLDVEENQSVKELCTRDLRQCFEACRPATRKLVQLDRLGSEDGAPTGGFAMDACSYCQYQTQDGVHVVFAGEVSRWPDFDAVANAHNSFMRGEEDGQQPDEAAMMLRYYASFKDEAASAADATEGVLEALALMEGTFAFVLYDERLQRVMAARDRAGAAPLFWGSTPDNRFMLGSSTADLGACAPSATPFPAGSLYASQGPNVALHPGQGGWIMPGSPHHGSLHSFVQSRVPGRKWRDLKAVPRLTPDGCLFGSVYKVASEANLAGISTV